MMRKSFDFNRIQFSTQLTIVVKFILTVQS